MAICTIEKANVAINRLAQEGRLGEVLRVHARIHACSMCLLCCAGLESCMQSQQAPPLLLHCLQASSAVWWWMSCTWCPTQTAALAWK